MRTLNFLALVMSVALTGCGGGGGGGGASGPVTSTELFQLRTAYVNSFNGSSSLPLTLSGTSSNYAVSGTGTITDSAPINGSFESASALQKNSTLTFTFTANGVTSSNATSGSSYVDSNYLPLGSSGSEYSVITSTNPIPVTARVGDTGTWSTANRYTNSSKLSLLGTTSTTYVLEPDTATTALLKIIDTDKNTAGVTVSTVIETYRITPAGAVTNISVSISDSPTYLTFTY